MPVCAYVLVRVACERGATEGNAMKTPASATASVSFDAYS